MRLLYIVLCISIMIGIGESNAQSTIEAWRVENVMDDLSEDNAEPLFVNEDRIWEFEYIEVSPMSREVNIQLIKYKFDGIKNIDGKEYHILRNFHTTQWQEYPQDKAVQEKDVDIEIALVREDNGKVWMRNLSDKVYRQEEDKSNSDFNLTEIEGPEDILLFDFNLTIDDTFTVWAFDPYTHCQYYITDYLLLSIDTDNERKCFTAGYMYPIISKEEFKFSPGVGNIGNGTILGPQTANLQPTDGSGYEYTFNNQYDLEGNVVFAGKGTKVPEFGGVVDIITERDTERMYDMPGREIRNPQPGTIYIQNNRKFIAK